MAKRSTPSLGPQIDEVFPDLPHWDNLGPKITEPSYRLGNRETGTDGHEYVWVQASANIAAAADDGTQVLITPVTYQTAAGAGGYYAPPDTAILAGDYFHARQGTLTPFAP